MIINNQLTFDYVICCLRLVMHYRVHALPHVPLLDRPLLTEPLLLLMRFLCCKQRLPNGLYLDRWMSMLLLRVLNLSHITSILRTVLDRLIHTRKLYKESVLKILATARSISRIGNPAWTHFL
ncbi:hypothetical protein MRB53_020846 [Persea americana]|uniref:Uncharacterized protein n=1 Tax=Persea americana TaxID=3435 RepID=A0ACC2L3C8_PERAE|nr:hypothetical protein MRB53_020846 [Persea americana]